MYRRTRIGSSSASRALNLKQALHFIHEYNIYIYIYMTLNKTKACLRQGENGGRSKKRFIDQR